MPCCVGFPTEVAAACRHDVTSKWVFLCCLLDIMMLCPQDFTTVGRNCLGFTYIQCTSTLDCNRSYRIITCVVILVQLKPVVDIHTVQLTKLHINISSISYSPSLMLDWRMLSRPVTVGRNVSSTLNSRRLMMCVAADELFAVALTLRAV
jgi:hypothetical protein